MIEHFDRTAQPTTRGHSKPWREHMQRLVTQQILSTEKSKGEILFHVKQQLKAAWKGRMTDVEMKEIDKIKAKTLTDCVKSLTRKLLNMHLAELSKATRQYPNIDVTTLYRIIRCKDLNSSFAAFYKHLRSMPQLKSIQIHNPGILFAIFLHDMYVEFAWNNKQNTAQLLLTNQPNAIHRYIRICKRHRPGMCLEMIVKSVYVWRGKLIQCLLLLFDT